MDLSMVIGDWPYDSEDANNVRKVPGVDGTIKVQLRIRCGLIQWETEGRPDGRPAHSFPSMLDYCSHLVSHRRFPSADSALGRRLVEELAEEMFDYYRRGRALFLLGDYRRSLADAVHNLRILRLVRNECRDASAVSNYDRYRPNLLLERSRSEMLLHLQEGDVRLALDALSRGVRDIEAFYAEYDMHDKLGESTERQILVDLRRSLREKHNVPLNDEELLHSLRVEQEIAISRENYEMAARLRDKIRLLRHRADGTD
ncbi:MAG: hypothetical protein GXY85_02490 [Candidatus Brocadiaceae bacterium]|nr:hypothetical protein [Candidatus Brocadiaceae bacterium]